MITVTENDVICGRGFSILHRPGNQRYRAFVASLKPECDAAAKRERCSFAVQIVNLIYSLSPPGRFLKKDEITGHWSEVTKKEAIRRARQALRDAPKCGAASGSSGGQGKEQQQSQQQFALKGQEIKYIKAENRALRNELSLMREKIDEMNSIICHMMQHSTTSTTQNPAEDLSQNRNRCRDSEPAYKVFKGAKR